MSTASYQVGVDLDKDGFVCWDAQSGDALNLIPLPVSLAGVASTILNSATSVTKVFERTDYGLNLYRVVSGTGVNAGMRLGADGSGTVDDIPVSASTQYTVVAWVKGSAGSIPMAAQLVDQTPATLVGIGFNLSTSWQRITMTGTTGVSSTHVEIRIRKNNDATNVTFDCAGFMLVAGSSGPTAFNAGDSSNALDNLTDDVVGRLQWTNGMADTYEEFARPSRLMVELSNINGDFSPENSSSGYYGLLDNGVMIQVRAAFSSTIYELYTGFIEKPRIQPGLYSDKIARLTAVDPMPQLQRAEYIADFQEDVTTDAVIEQVFGAAPVVLPHPAAYWVLGTTANSLLGTSTVPFLGTEYLDLETGATSFNFVGDLAESEVTTAQSFLRNIVAGECGGLFWWDTRAARFKFFGRHHWALLTAAATITGDDFESGEYIHDPSRNIITVEYQPREVGSAGSILWSARDLPFRLAPGDSRTFSVTYRDPNNESARVGAKDFIPPRHTVDYITNTKEDGSGRFPRRYTPVSVEFGASRSRVTIENGFTRDVYVTNLQLRGTPIYTYGRDTVQIDYADGFINDNVNDYVVRVPAVDDADVARNYAQSLLTQFKDPIPRFATIQMIANKDDTRLTNALSLTIGDLVSVEENNLSHAADYIIVGEQHQVSVGKPESTHTTQWILRPAGNLTYWYLGDSTYSILGTTTIPIF